MKLLVQPDDGIKPLVEALNKAKQRIEIVIFRFDRKEVEKAISKAAGRGVFVHALIAYTNRGGEKNLRKLELRLLAAGVTVARTADDLARYHSKFMVIDRRELHVLAFNFTCLDVDHSRSFGLITRNTKLVQEAVKLFEADTTRQPYTAGLANFVVSPVNARKQLAAFIKGAKKELLIYDPEISDPVMIKLLEERANAGVEIKIIGRLTQKKVKLEVHKLQKIRLHTRTMVRDSHLAFIGSQSLREVELNARREVGVIFREPKIISRIVKIFREDWVAVAKPREEHKEEVVPANKVAKKVAKAVAKELPPFAPVVQDVVKQVVGDKQAVGIDLKVVEESVKDAVKEAVKEAVRDAVEEVAEQHGVDVEK